MAEKIVRVRRRRRTRSLPGVESLDIFRRDLSPRRAALLVGIFVVVLIVGVIVFNYGSKIYAGWRERSLLQRATTLLQQGKLPEAAQAARDVLEVHNDSLPAFYVLAEAAEKRNLEEAVSWRAQIARLLPSDLDSQLNLASAALRFNHLDTARNALGAVETPDRDRARYHIVAGWLAQAEGDMVEQERQFAIAAKQEPNNDVYQFNLAALQIRSPEPERSAFARQTLERLRQSPDFRTGSLRALLNDSIDRSDLESADRYAQELQMSQQVTFADYLLCLNLYQKRDQQNPDKKFDALLDKVKPVAAKNPRDLALLLDWMNNSGLASEVLKWVDKLPAELTTHPPPAVSVAESFVEMKNWSRLKRWTRSGSWGDQDYLRFAYQSYAARRSRQTVADAESDRLWRSAEQGAAGAPEREANLARLATRWNLSIEATQLWSSVSTNPGTRREALDALYKIYRKNNEVRKLYDVLQKLHEGSPNEMAIAGELARLGLNIEHNTKQAQDLAKEVYDRAPDNPDHAVTYAFALYGLGRTTEGLDIMRKIPSEKLHDPHTAVYMATLLLDENETEVAKEYVNAAQEGSLYAEERKLLEEAKVKLAPGSQPPAPGKSSSPQPSPTAAKPTPVPDGG